MSNLSNDELNKIPFNEAKLAKEIFTQATEQAQLAAKEAQLAADEFKRKAEKANVVLERKTALQKQKEVEAQAEADKKEAERLEREAAFAQKQEELILTFAENVVLLDQLQHAAVAGILGLPCGYVAGATIKDGLTASKVADMIRSAGQIKDLSRLEKGLKLVLRFTKK